MHQVLCIILAVILSYHANHSIDDEYYGLFLLDAFGVLVAFGCAVMGG